MGWVADYIASSSFVEPQFGCPSGALRPTPNASFFCSRSLDRQVHAALADQGAEAVGRWTAIDRRLVDLAPAVPLTNRRSVLLVSKRVGNVQHHQVYYTLLDQLWVR